MPSLTKKGQDVFNGLDLDNSQVPVNNAEAAQWATQMETAVDGLTAGTFIPEDLLITANTRAEIKALDTTEYTAAMLIEGNRSGTFYWKFGDYSSHVTADSVEGWFLKADAIATTVGAWVRSDEKVNLLHFGAVGDGTTANDTAVDDWIAVAKLVKYPAYAPTGIYKLTSQFAIDAAGGNTEGFTFYGDGRTKTIFDLQTVTTSPNMKFSLTGGTPVSPLIQAYFNIHDFGVRGDIDGIVLAIGENDYSDQINGASFREITVQNFNNSADSCGIEVNAVYWCEFKFNAVCGAGDSPGDATAGSTAIRVRQSAFSKYWISGGGAETGLHLTNTFNYGNTFNACDFEIVEDCVKIDNVSVTKNVFIGGQFSYHRYGVKASAGSYNVFINNNENPSVGATSFFDASNSVGINKFDQTIFADDGIELADELYQTSYVLNASIVSGGTYSDTGKTKNVIWTTAGDASALTINLPSSPKNGQIREYSFVYGVTTLTISNGSILGTAPSSIPAGGGKFKLMYNTASSVWMQV